ncbi:LpqB family beta-propeller domain-containing protein [Amycolatopsis sp. NPDC059021]|uniref:LpqB family beta-propeller domain-containing protein n=1 Tax=Amycolatopsis sp. NPDC059021 TaxID=3346704 RepID=UPI00366ADD27
MKRAVLAVLCLVLLAGCANIPQESQPMVVPGDKPPQPAASVSEPSMGIDSLTLARQFVRASAVPGSNNAAARAYLDDQARANWKPARGLTIIDDIFNTTYDTENRTPDPNVQTVNVHGFALGVLNGDGSFVPNQAPFKLQLEVRKQQATGQWRIVNPPPNLVVTNADFSINYFRVPVSFYSPDAGTFVPDLRYVVAKPQSGLAGRVMDLLMLGPSEGLAGSVKNLLADPVTIENNVKTADDGSVVVPLTGLTGATPETRNLIAAQIVLSLQTVTSTRIRLLADGAPLVPGHEYWRASELPAYAAAASPSSDLLGLMTAGGRLRSLGTGAPVEGPAGSGGYDVASAAQSIDGKRLAVVERTGGRMRLRVGDFGRDLPQTELFGGSLTRPTWRPAAPGGDASGEVWTVVDHTTVARLVLAPGGHWAQQGVNANEVTALGQITELRLSRDGSRAAAVVGGKLVVASVVRTADSVTLRAPRLLQNRDLANVVDVDWATTDTLVASTSSTSQPVVKLPIDGLRMDAFNSSNLTPPVHSVTAAPNRPIVVADGGGLWFASELGEVWRPHTHTTPGADAFYPG